jgi:hypothetical protein
MLRSIIEHILINFMNKFRLYEYFKKVIDSVKYYLNISRLSKSMLCMNLIDGKWLSTKTNLTIDKFKVFF